jgi:hypothetical protein
MSDYSEEMASTIEGVQIDGSSIPDDEDLLREPDYICVRHEDRVGLSPNPKSPNFDELNTVVEGYVLFWIPDVDIRGVDPLALTPATWMEFLETIVKRLLLGNSAEILRWLSNSREFIARYHGANEILEYAIDGLAKEYAYDFRRWGF